ncbi:hypothetical protein NW768_005884 [Fusarium equiseti]|uniref:Uncharacterized protein n=1 Tax=Fusarium equiseti TaxID=61235 RepID=A0ABQ8RD47_FUSEQ|nr:hypothetical protein NW768_005884 [Fusarium equiseti]
MFRSIIKNSGAQLRLSPLAFEPRGPYYDWNQRNYGNKRKGEEFLDFIERCCSAGASDELDRVIEETFEGLLEAQSTWILAQNQAEIITYTLAPIIRMFQGGWLKSVPALGDVLELLVRIVIKYDLPQSPQTRREWEFSPRGCDACADCEDMNQFLTSPTQLAWKFTAPGKRRTHIEHALRMDSSMSIDLKQEPDRGRCLTLTVTKKKAQPPPILKWWQQTFRQLKDAVQPLEGDWMKEFLGEQRYREIILLEGVTPYANPPSMAGTRRPAPEGEIQLNKRHCTSLQASEIGTGPAIKQEVIVIDD